jgi:uncharacterized damage-inducible protein DinB
MYRKIEDFLKSWKVESEGTQRLLDALTDASLAQAVADGHRTIGRLVWHIVTSLPEMAARTGLKLDAAPDPESQPPERAEDMQKAYQATAAALADRVKADWDDATLEIEDDMYGEQWKRGVTLMIMQTHEIHHRGQLTVLMRQAGLTVPGIYGPAKEEWSKYNMPVPEV